MAPDPVDENRHGVQLTPVLNLLKEANVVLGQAVRSSALPKQCEVPEGWGVVVFVAFGN